MGSRSRWRLVLAVLTCAVALFRWRRRDEPVAPVDGTAASIRWRGEPNDDRSDDAIRRRARRSRFRRVAVTLSIGGVSGIVGALVAASLLTRAPPSPPPGGTARILVPANEVNGSDRYQLWLLMRHPNELYVEYHVVAGCDSTARRIILMLSGNARLQAMRTVLSPGLSATARATQVGPPWFQSLQPVQLIELPFIRERCPAHVNSEQLGAVASVGGFATRSFETAAGSDYALQLPQVGDQTNSIAFAPTVGGSFGAPVRVAVSIAAGVLPLEDQIDVARPALSNSGGLTWSREGFVVPAATWTNVTSQHRVQFFLFVLGALIGISGSLLAAIAFEFARP